MNSTKINYVQYTTEPIVNTVHNSKTKLPILNPCLICSKLTTVNSAHKTARFSDNIKTFCEFFSINKISFDDFENRFSTSSLCRRCKERINLIARVVRDVNRLKEQLDILRESVCSDLTRVNGFLASSAWKDVDQGLNTQNSSHNKPNQENQCEITLQQKMRNLLKERLAIPILWRSKSLVHSTQVETCEYRNRHNISSFDRLKSVESHDDCVNTNGKVAETITITVFPSSSNSSDRPIIEFQGVDYVNTEADEDFLEICQTSLDSIPDDCNDFQDFANQGGDVFEEDDIKIEENEDVSSDLEMTAVDEIRTNSATPDTESNIYIPVADIEVDLNRNRGDRNESRNGIKTKESKNVSEPIEIQPPAELPIKLKKAVVIITRLSPRSLAKLKMGNMSSMNNTKGRELPVLSSCENLNYSADSSSGQEPNTDLDSSKTSNNESNTVVKPVTLSSNLITYTLDEASLAGTEVEVENFSEFLDVDNIVEIEVETDTTVQDVCEPAKALRAKSNKLNPRKALRKFECPFVDPVKGCCPKKGRRFINQQRLDAHLNRKHYGRKRHHTCKQCNITLNSLKKLREHEYIHSGVKAFICKTCAEPFRTENFLLFHQRKAHGEPYPFVCDVCSKGFNFASPLRTHMRSHTGELRFRCEECKAGFYYQSALNNHILIHTSERQSAEQDVCESAEAPSSTPVPSDKINSRKAKAHLKFECPFVDPAKGYCPKLGRRYIDQERLDAHLNRMHYGKKKYHEYQCKQCPVSVNTFKKLRDHEKLHSGVKDFICGTCSESFRTENFLLFHQRKVHGELYPFLCDVCSKGFNYACYLRLHMLSHAGEFGFRCEECKAGFHHKSALDKHIITHATERPFSCECCSKKFTSKGGLTVHMTTHVEDKAWLCDTCGKSFKSRQRLTDHSTVHRTDKSFACQMCDFKTKTKACLWSHSRRYCKNRKKT